MAFRYLIACLALATPILVHAYGAGAPQGACGDMVPQHHVDGQKGKSPYDLHISKQNIRGGEVVQLVLKGKQAKNTIRGVLVQARVGDQPIGRFIIPKNNPHIQTLDCGNGQVVSIVTTFVLFNLITNLLISCLLDLVCGLKCILYCMLMTVV